MARVRARYGSQRLRHDGVDRLSFRTELHIPPDRDFTTILDAFVADAARRAGLGDAHRDDVVAAARLGFETIVDEAMAESREHVRIVATCTPARLTLALHERGLPIGDAQALREPRWSEITHKVDQAHWHAHGRAGSELRLIVERPHGLPVDDPPPRAEPDDVPLAPPQEYTIRRFHAADAAGVARAFYLTYGYHYDFPAVYVPSRLIELNARQEYISIVAVAQDGEIAGHYALAREGDSPIADGGGAVVVPAHRGRDLLNRLRHAAEDEARRIGLAAYYTEPVTDHGRTQHASETFGAKACGLTLGLSPANFVARHMELSTTTQRQSFMLYVRPLQTREPRTIYAPARHRRIVERIYAQLGLPVTLAEGEPQKTDPPALRTAIIRADDVGTIDVTRTGKHDAALVKQAVSDMRALRRLGGIFVSLPLEDPGTPHLCEALEELGFFFSGVGPWMLEGRDSLRLQMPLTPIDLSALTVIGDFGKELAAYVASERDRVAALGSSA